MPSRAGTSPTDRFSGRNARARRRKPDFLLTRSKSARVPSFDGSRRSSARPRGPTHLDGRAGGPDGPMSTERRERSARPASPVRRPVRAAQAGDWQFAARFCRKLTVRRVGRRGSSASRGDDRPVPWTGPMLFLNRRKRGVKSGFNFGGPALSCPHNRRSTFSSHCAGRRRLSRRRRSRRSRLPQFRRAGRMSVVDTRAFP